MSSPEQPTHCLIDLLKDYEHYQGQTIGKKVAAKALNEAFLTRIQNDFEFACRQCPMMATLQIIGNAAIIHSQNKHECSDPDNRDTQFGSPS